MAFGPGARGSTCRRAPEPASGLRHYTDGALTATRAAYGQARVELGPVLTPAEITSAQEAISAQGARFLQLQRELVLVEGALSTGKSTNA